MRNINCIMCDEATVSTERLYAADFKMTGRDVPLCDTCESDSYKYLSAVLFSRAMWKNKIYV